MLSICLNYAGTGSELNCTIDGERLTAVAKESGVEDIVKVYDDGSTSLWPCKEDIYSAVEEMAQRCEPGDVFVLHYSGHGGTSENEEEANGVDSTLCFRSRDGEMEEMVDDELAELISTTFDKSVMVIVLADACHSAGVLDCDVGGIWKKRKVCSISGCQDLQCANDTGDGGAMTNALLRVLAWKKVQKLRKRGKASVQYIFNRMIEEMPEEEDEEEDEEEGDEEEEQEEDEEEEGEVDPVTGNEPEPGQNINLAWPGGCDPSMIPFPF